MTTKPQFLQYLIDFHSGNKNMTTFANLKSVFSLKDDRKLREWAKELVHDGHRVITCSKGVYYADSDRDVIIARRNIEKRFFALTRDLKDLDNLLSKQMNLFG